jgi:hypothetical protein
MFCYLDHGIFGFVAVGELELKLSVEYVTLVPVLPLPTTFPGLALLPRTCPLPFCPLEVALRRL